MDWIRRWLFKWRMLRLKRLAEEFYSWHNEPFVCRDCGWATWEPEGWCWIKAIGIFPKKVSCPLRMADTPEALKAWQIERETEVHYERGR